MIDLKVILFVFILFVLPSNFIFADEQTGSIKLDLTYSSGYQAGGYGVALKVFQDNESIPYREISGISVPIIIDYLPLEHEYNIKVFVNNMFVNSRTIELTQQEENINIVIPTNKGLVLQIFYKDNSPISGAQVKIKSHDSVEWANSVTGNNGKTQQFWLAPSTKLDDFYIAEISLVANATHTVKPIRLTGQQEIKVVTEWPSIIQSISIELYKSPQAKIGKPDGNYLVEMYDEKNQKIAQSDIDRSGSALFTLMKIGNYNFKVFKKTEDLKNVLQVASKEFTIDGSKSAFSIFLNSPGSIMQSPEPVMQSPEPVMENPEPVMQSPDSTPPSISITDPSYCANNSFKTRAIRVEGTTSDSSGIEKVEAFAHPLPHDGTFPFVIATPMPPDWSKWYIDLEIPEDDKTYRVLVKATDKTGNENWVETFVKTHNVEELDISGNLHGSNEQEITRIALVVPTFTEAAYNVDGFYSFYSMYYRTPEGAGLTKDLNRLKSNIPFSNEDASMINAYQDLIQKFSPDSIITVIEDQDVHQNLIFTKDGKNAYDTIFMFHNEYVTQNEYDNLRKFVKNGGNIVFIDGNVFFAEVTYDEPSCSVTLVKGHHWEFDGNTARKSAWERYLYENREWMGSNFIIRDITDPVQFDNNPFNYTHFEENEVMNPNAKILIDYGAKFKITPPSHAIVDELKPAEYSDRGKVVATYELEYGKGKVIMLGIYAQHLVNNTAFTDFFDNMILPRVLGSKYDLNVDNEKFEIFSKLQGGRVSQINLDKESKSLILELDMENKSESSNKIMSIIMPKKLIDTNNTKLDGFTVFADDQNVLYSQSFDDVNRGLTITLPAEAKEVRITGTQVIPEFSILSLPLIGSIFALPIIIKIYHTRRKMSSSI
jgi:hypothetical protein